MAITGFRLSRRDPFILKAISDCQALTVKQLISLFWNSPNPAYTRLRQLLDEGYLEEHYITQISAAPAASPKVFTISKLGAAVLAEHFGYSREDCHFFSRQIGNWQSFQPIHMTNNVRVALTRACQDADDVELAEWRNEAQFRANPDMVYINHKQTPVYPDGFCIVYKLPARTFNFIEADSGTEGLSQVTRQLKIYLEYTASGLYEQTFGTQYWRVLLITNSRKRLDNIRRKAAEIGCGANFWFTTFDQLTSQTVLSQPIWLKTQGETRHCFI